MTATPTPLRERCDALIAKWLDAAGHLPGRSARPLQACADELKAALSARDEAGACNCASGRGAEHCVVHAPNDVLPSIATPPASGEAEAVDGPDAAWKQASSEVFSTPLSQVREKYGTGDLYKAIASRADELRATPPAASSGDGIESVRRAIEDYIAEMRCLAHTDWADLTNFVNAQFRRLAAVAPAGMEGWIPVSERLPEEYGWYHCAVEGVGDLGMARWQEIVSLGHYADYGKRFSTAGGVRVTHWRPLGPLPTPPATAGEE